MPNIQSGPSGLVVVAAEPIDVDPTIAPGYRAPMGSMVVTTSTGIVYVKYSSSDTGWTAVSTKKSPATPAAKSGTNLTDADATIQPISDGCSEYTQPASVPLTNNRVTTIGITGAVALAKAVIVTIVRRDSGAFSLTVKDDAGTTIGTFASGSAPRADTFYFDTVSGHYKYLSSTFVA